MASLTAVTGRVDDLLDRVWLAGSAPQTTMVLLVLAASTLAMAAILPQAPAGLAAEQLDRWTTAASAPFGASGAILSSLGLFTILHGVWTQALLGIAALHLLLRSAAQLRFLALRARSTAVPEPPAGIEQVTGDLQVSIDAATERATGLTKEYFTGSQYETQAPTRLTGYGERTRLGYAGPLFTYLGLLMLLGGLLLDGAAGWRRSELSLAPGDSVSVGEPAVELVLSSIESLPAGHPVARLTLERAAGAAATLVPARWGSLWVALRGTGPALQVQASDLGGRPLLLQTLGETNTVAQSLALSFRQTQSEQAFAAPASNLTFRAVSYPSLPEREITGPVFLVEAYRGDDPTPAASELIEESGELELDDVRVTFARAQHAELEAGGLPGLLPLAVGALLILLGVALTAWRGPARLWIHLGVVGGAVRYVVQTARPPLDMRAPSDMAARLGGSNMPAPSRSPMRLPLVLWGVCAAALLALLRAGSPDAVALVWLRDAALALGLAVWPVALVSELHDRSRPDARLAWTVAQLGFPFLTLAWVSGAIFTLVTRAAPWLGTPPEFWAMVAWLVGALYLHARSPWRPLPGGAWVARASAVAVCIAGGFAVWTLAATAA